MYQFSHMFKCCIHEILHIIYIVFKHKRQLLHKTIVKLGLNKEKNKTLSSFAVFFLEVETQIPEVSKDSWKETDPLLNIVA